MSFININHSPAVIMLAISIFERKNDHESRVGSALPSPQEPGWGVAKHSALPGERLTEVFMAVAEIHTLRSGSKESSMSNVYLSACLFWASQAMWLASLQFACNLKAEPHLSNLPHSYYHFITEQHFLPGPRVIPFTSTGEREETPPGLHYSPLNVCKRCILSFFFVHISFCKLPRARLQRQLPLFTSAPLSTW